MGPHRALKRIWLIPPARLPGRGATMDPGRDGDKEDNMGTNAAGRPGVRGPDLPKRGEGVPRELLGYECNMMAIQGPIIIRPGSLRK